jgi:hypothetical protein
MESTGILLMGSCFILVGIATAALFLLKISKAVKSTKWPWVFGDLDSADLRLVVYTGRDSGGADNASALVVDFKYRYSVKGIDYNGKRVTYSDGINKTVGSLKKLQERYRGKSQIQVYYDPERPGECVLVPGLNIFNFTPLITSALFVMAGLFIIFYDF